MTNSNPSSTQPLRPAPSVSSGPAALLAVIAGVSFVGFVDSAYLLADHYFKLPLPCAIMHGCETVLTSPYAMVGPVPLAFFGVAYYLVVMFFALHIYTDITVRRSHLLALFALTLVGALMSVVFVSIQAFLIGAFCMYCLLSALCTFVLVGAGAWVTKVRTA